MPTIKANQIDLYYEVHGQGEPLVFAAGFNTDHHVFDKFIDIYKKHFQVIVFDYRGTGQSSAPEMPYTIEMMADDLIALCDALHLEKCHFVGGSMGVGIILSLASRYPERCKKLVLSNGAIKLDPRLALLMQLNLELLKVGVDQKVVVKTFWPWLFSKNFLNQPNALEKMQQRLDETFTSFPLAGYEGHLHAVLHGDLSPWLSKIEAPTLVIGCDEDRMVPEKEIRALAEGIKGAKYHCFAGIGHSPHVEVTEEFHRLIQQFLLEDKI